MTQAGAPLLEALDGKVYLTAEGVTIERSKSRAASRRVATVISTPWSSIAGASVTSKALRIDVAGCAAPRMVESDPWGVRLKRGQEHAAAAFTALLHDRCAGGEAQPIITEVDEQPAAPGPEILPRPAAGPAVTPWPVGRAADPREQQRLGRLLRIAEFSYGLEMVLIVLPLVVLVIVLVVGGIILAT